MIKLAFVLLSAAATVAAADTALVTKDGHCAAGAPAGWTVPTYTKALATSPDGKSSFAVSSLSASDSFDEVKSTVKSMYKDDKVTKETATEIELEGKGQTGKPNIYRAVGAGKTFCAAEVTYESGTVAAARAIARTLKVAK